MSSNWAQRLIALLAVGCVFAVKSQAAVYYVSTSGANTNDGSLAHPWRTVQNAANNITAGDVVNIRAGTYHERVTVDTVLGTATQPIVFQKYAGDSGTVTIDQSGVTPPAGPSALLTISNSNFITLQNIEVANYQTVGSNTAQKAQDPGGIYITGGCNGIKLLGCKVHHISQNCTLLNDFGANGFGILVYGNDSTAIDNLVMDSCEVYALHTGASESVAFNGNVTHFTVTHNSVHDCNNIGIDFIGFEQTAPQSSLDQTRLGTCTDNVVYGIDSKFNPAYGGNLTTGGPDSTRSAPGLYVDGGRDIVLERNHVYSCNYALSVGSEHLGKAASNITARDNVFHHCHVGGIVMGGSSNVDNGGTTGCSFTNNTLYDNDTTGSGGGQVAVQNFVTNCLIQRNLMVTTTTQLAQFIINDNATSSFSSGAIDWNLYRCHPDATYEFIYRSAPFDNDFAGWRSAGGTNKDAHSSLITASAALVNSAPSADSPATDFAITSISPAKDAGDGDTSPFTPASGETDFFGHSRVINGRVDIGASEYAVAGPTAWELWQIANFGSSTAPGTGPADDPDKDGVSNLIEYSQGRNPNVKEYTPVVQVSITGGTVRASYKKAVAGLTYTLQQSTAVNAGWSDVSTPESSDGSVLFWREVPFIGSRKFFRLQVTLP